MIRKLAGIAEYAIWIIWNGKKKILLIVTTIAIVLVLLFFYVSYYEAARYAVKKIKDVWNVNEDKVYHLDVTPSGPEDYSFAGRMRSFLKKIKEDEGIDKLAIYYVVSNSEEKVLVAERDTFDIFGVYALNDSDFIWPGEQGLFGGSDVLSRINKNNVVFVDFINSSNDAEPWMYFQNIYFTTNNNDEDFYLKLVSCANELNLGVRVERLSEMYDKYIAQKNLIYGENYLQLIIILVLTVLIISSTIIIINMDIMREHMIMIVFGYSKKRVSGSICLASLLLSITSFLVAAIVILYIVIPTSYKDETLINAAREYAIPQIGRFSVVIGVCGGIVPSIIINNSNIISTLKRGEE
jgi:hypothetical protein